MKMLRRTLLKLIAVTVMASVFLIGTGSGASAGQICVRARLFEPLPDVRVCFPTFPY